MSTDQVREVLISHGVDNSDVRKILKKIEKGSMPSTGSSKSSRKSWKITDTSTRPWN